LRLARSLATRRELALLDPHAASEVGIVAVHFLDPEHYQLFTIRPDGSGAKQITHLFSARNPDWSPNGKTIVAEVESKNGAGITLLSPTGSVVRYLTPKGYQGQPSFSPDGKWIVYERDIAPGNNGVWLMRSNGTALRRVTRNPFGAGECGCDTDPNFSPNGKWISFVRIRKDHEQQGALRRAAERNGSPSDHALFLGGGGQARLVAGREADRSDDER
jgi:Tol biopolymer transport system component